MSVSLHERLISVCIALLLCTSLNGQERADTTLIRKDRLVPLMIGEAALAGGSLTALHFMWYANYERQPFTFFDDNRQWLQMDKLGHTLTAYQVSAFCDRSLRWSGLAPRKAMWIGSATSLAYLTTIELMDAYSVGWGFSTGDAIANAAGCGLYISQEILWQEQRLRMKFNFLPSPYAQYRPDLLGVGFAAQMLKDYNGQAYWLCSNPHDWINGGEWPKWLDLALGYSASGMTGGTENAFPLLNNGAEAPDVTRVRQYYLSLDLNLHALPARRAWFRAFRNVFAFIKIPAPAIGIDSNGRIIGGLR